MRIAFINGSPKVNDSSSSYALQALKTFLEGDSNIISEYYFRKPQLNTEDMRQLAECDALVFAFPLYVDGIPSHMLNSLIQLETYLASIKEKEIRVYSLVNCGFYEGHQNGLAIEMMQNWSLRAGLEWGQGVGIGAGGMLSMLRHIPIGYGPMKNLKKAFTELTNNILNRASGESIFITANFPRFAYKLAGEMEWRQSIKANGLKRKDLFLRK